MNGVFEQERDEGVSALQVALNEEKVMEKKLTSIQVCVSALIASYSPHMLCCSEG